MINLLNFIKIILMIDTVCIILSLVYYFRNSKKIDEELDECINILKPIIYDLVKNKYRESRNKFILKDIKDVYTYEQILSTSVYKEILSMKYNKQIHISKHLKEDEIDMLIMYEIHKLGIMVDVRTINQKPVNEKPKQTTVDISDSLMM